MENEILNVVKRMNKIADGNPFVFDCAIIENGSDEVETMTFCLCDEGQYDKIAQTYFDNMIFFYINKPEDIIGFLNGSEDFNVVDVYETSMEIIYEEDLVLA